ncbi:MAG: zf-HC2 domain-containing protein [Holophagales bacterium]|nr:zf-HC2 domain-containing protein [Holophagales bacterium]
MDCEASEPLIEALCDDELDVAAAARLVAHLDGCAGCSAFRRELETRKAAVREARPVDRLPDEVRARLVRQAGRTIPSGRRGGVGLRFAGDRRGGSGRSRFRGVLRFEGAIGRSAPTRRSARRPGGGG